MATPIDALAAFPEPRDPERPRSPGAPRSSVRAVLGVDPEDPLSGDVRLADAIRQIDYDCTHPRAEMLITNLAAYGAGTLINMWQAGRLFSACKGWLPPPTNSWLATAPEYLEHVAAAAAVKFVAQEPGLRTWTREGGASIKTYYIGFSLFEFKAQYLADQGWRQHERLAEPDAPELAIGRAPDDPAHQAVQRVTIAEALSRAESPQVPKIVEMLAKGASQQEIAKALGVSVKTVERRLREYREALSKNGWAKGIGAE